MHGNDPSETVSIGPWKFTLGCTPSLAKYQLTGPGSIAYTSTFGDNNVSGASTTNGNFAFSEGAFEVGAGNERQSYFHAFVYSGTTLEEIDVEVSASNGGLFEICGAAGDAIPVS